MSLIKALQWIPGDNPLSTKKPQDLTCTEDLRLRVDAVVSQSVATPAARYESSLSPNSQVVDMGAGYGEVLTATLPGVASCSGTSIFVHHYGTAPAVTGIRVEVVIGGQIVVILYGGDYFQLEPSNLNQDVTVNLLAGTGPTSLTVSLNQFIEVAV